MKRILPLLVIVAVSVFYVFANDDGHEINNSVKGNVARVLDGDTLELRDGQKVRLIGINTPEKGQPYGEEAINEVRRLVTNKELKLLYDKEKEDDYGRTLAYAYVDEKFINLHLVKSGLALVETVPPNEKHEGDFMEAELDAQKNCKGLWEGLCVKGERGSACIVIAEINADAPGNDNENLNGEWIKLQNRCDEDVPLDGYLLKDRTSSNNYFFKNITLNSNNSLTLFSGCGEDTTVNIFWQCPEKRSSVWNNDTDQAYLYDKNGLLTATKGY